MRSQLRTPVTHLHVHSNYSLQDGACRVDDLAVKAAAMGMDSLALTDHDGMYGAVRFSLACRDAGVRPILGAELEWGDGFHAVFLAENATGWSNLCHLVTEMHLSTRAQSLMPGARPRTTFSSIARYSEGLFALSGCTKGEVAWYAELGRIEEATAAASRWRTVFEDRFAIELSNHLLPGDGLRNRRLLDIAQSLSLKSVATNNVHYVTPQDSVIHDVSDCIRRIVALSAATAPRKNQEYWLKPSLQMQALHPQEAIDATRDIAERCRYELPFGSFHFPQMGATSTSVLAKRCWDGVRRRFPVVTKAIEERLQMELRMIRRGGFCGYFMVVADIVDHAKRVLGIRCACRGSAAGSLVAYVLDISDVDPIAYNLVFERFMNEHRVEIPDIDVDFESQRREEMNAYILGTYGNATSMVAMMQTYRARGALREVGKALGINPSEVDIVAKAFPHVSAKQIPEALESLPEVASIGLKASRFEMLFDLAARMDGFPRHLAMHPSGVILSDGNLAHLMPMQRSSNGYLVSQFDKDDVEALGLAKLDVLGVRMFSSMTLTLEQIERRTGERIDLSVIARDDPATFELIRDSRTLGCFQIESPGQRELLGKFQPTTFEDLIIDISLFRPGPMKADMIKPFLNRRMGLETTPYAHPSLRPILRETNGVIVYHEQVMRVISALTGCDLGEADKIRRNLGFATGVLEKAKRRGWDADAAEKVWEEVRSFASFGFCKAHAAAFAVPTYQSAWLKVHYPAEFYCGVLTHDPGMYPRRAILADARAHDVPILAVDVNHSMHQYEP
ncbi:MAG: DNA polymerase III subunit alpha, partial [Actinomycetota bacterium]